MRRQIPVAPHVKQYLLSLYGPEPIHVSNLTRLGKLISICSERYYKVAPEQKLELQPGFTTLEIQLPKELKHAKFSPDKLYLLAEFLDKDFRASFIAHTTGSLNPQPSEYAAADSFLKLHKIDPEFFDRDALRKIWNRYEKNRDNIDRIAS